MKWNIFLRLTVVLRLDRKGPAGDHQVLGIILFFFTFKYLYLGKICSERQPRAELSSAAAEAAWGSTSRWCQNILDLSGSQYLRPCRLNSAGIKTGKIHMYLGNWRKNCYVIHNVHENYYKEHSRNKQQMLAHLFWSHIKVFSRYNCMKS